MELAATDEFGLNLAASRKVIILAWLALSTEVESRILVIFRHRRSLINYTHHVEEV